jgi:uncharacterized protein (DUF1786 family)
MRILAVDVGTGTQDILLFDSSKVLENCVQMIMPSPTTIIANRIKQATTRYHPILLSGVTMGGGPSKRALTQHTALGLAAYATVEAALTFNDDLEVVKGMGVTIVAPDEVPRATDLEVIELKDIDLVAIKQSLDSFGVNEQFDALAIAVLDHGFAPSMSNRLFRFEHLREILANKRELLAFCYLAQEVPDYLTRMKSVVKSIGVELPLLLIDTGVAAIMGALQDREVAQHDHLLIANMGNAHTIAFHLRHGLIEGLFEHHTRLLNATTMDSLIMRLAQGVLSNEEVYGGGGHGALVIHGDEQKPFFAVTGPRQYITNGSSLKIHRAIPHGDSMLTGCYGLVKACALRINSWFDEIEKALIRNT